MSSLRVALAGSGSFGVPTLAVLTAEPFEIIAVITKPDRPASRGRRSTSTPLKTAARSYGLRILEPERFADVLPELTNLDVLIVIDYGKIIPPEALDQRFKVVNLHPSLLPKYRGSSPIQSAILEGATHTGVTLMELDADLDHGPIVAQRTTPVGQKSFPELHAELAGAGAALLNENLLPYLRGEIQTTPQDDSAATFCRKLSKDDGRLDWTRSTAQLDRQIRALNPRPGTFTSWDGKQLKILEAQPADQRLAPAHVGEGLIVGTGDGALRVTRLQLEGRKAVTPEEFLRGYPRIIGATLN